MKNSNDIIGNRTRDLPACNAVPQSTAPPRASGNVRVCVLGGRGKVAEVRKSLITFSININSTWGFTFILIYVFGVWCLNKRQKITFYSVFIIDNYFSEEALQFKLKKISL